MTKREHSYGLVLSLYMSVKRLRNEKLSEFFVDGVISLESNEIIYTQRGIRKVLLGHGKHSINITIAIIFVLILNLENML